MGHEALAVVQALGLVHVGLHGEAKERVHVERRGVHDALVAQVALDNVAAKPHGQVVLELRDCHALELCGREVEVTHTVVLKDIAQPAHGVGVAKGLVGRGCADERHIGVHVHVNSSREELLGREGAGEHELVVLVAQAHGEARGRLPQADGQQVVDLVHHLLLHGAQVGHLDAGLVALAQALGGTAQVAREVAVHVAGVSRAGGLGHGLLGHHAVLLHEAAEHIPLTAVADGVGEQERHQAAIERLVKGVEDVLEEPVALLELVPEEGIGLRELEGLEVVLLDDAVAHGVEACEHPATAGVLLVAPLALRDLDIESQRVGGDALGAARGGADAVGGDGVLCDGVHALGREVLVRGGEVVSGDAGLVVHLSSYCFVVCATYSASKHITRACVPEIGTPCGAILDSH